MASKSPYPVTGLDPYTLPAQYPAALLSVGPDGHLLKVVVDGAGESSVGNSSAKKWACLMCNNCDSTSGATSPLVMGFTAQLPDKGGSISLVLEMHGTSTPNENIGTFDAAPNDRSGDAPTSDCVLRFSVELHRSDVSRSTHAGSVELRGGVSTQAVAQAFAIAVQAVDMKKHTLGVAWKPPRMQQLEATRRTLGGWDFLQILPCSSVDAVEGFGEYLLIRLRWPVREIPSSSLRSDTAAAPTAIVESLERPRMASLDNDVIEGLAGVHRYTLWAGVLMGTAELPDGPFVAFVDLTMRVSAEDDHLVRQDRTSGGAKFCLCRLSRATPPARRGRTSTTSCRVAARSFLEAGPLEAVLWPVLGPVVDVRSAHLDGMSATDVAQRGHGLSLVPPIFVASEQGIHCVLTHQVLVVAVPHIVAIAIVARHNCLSDNGYWHGVCCLVLDSSGRLAVVRLDTDGGVAEAVGAAPAEERAVYVLHLSHCTGDVPRSLAFAASAAIPSIDSLLVRVCEGTSARGASAVDGSWLLCTWRKTKLRTSVYSLRLDISSTRHNINGFQVKSVLELYGFDDVTKSDSHAIPELIDCCQAFGGTYDLLGVAVADLSTKMSSTSTSTIQIWHPGSLRTKDKSQAPLLEGISASSAVVLGGYTEKNHVDGGKFDGHSDWPMDIILLFVGAHKHGDIVIATSASRQTSHAFVLPEPPSRSAFHTFAVDLGDWGLINSRLTHHISLHHLTASPDNVVGSFIVQITDLGFTIFEFTSCHEPLVSLTTQVVEPLCCHAVTCEVATPINSGANISKEVWVFVAVATVISRYDVIVVRTSNLQCTVRQGMQLVVRDQVAALCMLGGDFGCCQTSDQGQPSSALLAVALWHGVEVMILDGGTLTELCSCSLGTMLTEIGRVCGMAGFGDVSDGDGRHDLLVVTVAGALVQLSVRDHRTSKESRNNRSVAASIMSKNVWPLGRGKWRLAPLVGSASPGIEACCWCVVIHNEKGVAFFWRAGEGLRPCKTDGARAVVGLSLGKSKGTGARSSMALVGGIRASGGIRSMEVQAVEGPVMRADATVRGEALAIVFVSAPVSCLAVLLKAPVPNESQRTAAKTEGVSVPLVIVLLDIHLDMVGIIPLSMRVFGAVSGTLYDIHGGVLIALSSTNNTSMGGAPALFAPPRMLLRLNISLLPEDGAWLDSNIVGQSAKRDAKPSSKITGNIEASLQLERPAVMATHRSPDCPVLLGEMVPGAAGPSDIDGQHAALRCLDASTLLSINCSKYGASQHSAVARLSSLNLGARGAISALKLGFFCSPVGPPVICVFVAFAAGGPAVLRLRHHILRDASTSAAASAVIEFEVIRIVSAPGASPEEPLTPCGPIVQAVVVEESATASRGSFSGFVAADGLSRLLAWHVSVALGTTSVASIGAGADGTTVEVELRFLPVAPAALSCSRSWIVLRLAAEGGVPSPSSVLCSVTGLTPNGPRLALIDL